MHNKNTRKSLILTQQKRQQKRQRKEIKKMVLSREGRKNHNVRYDGPKVQDFLEPVDTNLQILLLRSLRYQKYEFKLVKKRLGFILDNSQDYLFYKYSYLDEQEDKDIHYYVKDTIFYVDVKYHDDENNSKQYLGGFNDELPRIESEADFQFLIDCGTMYPVQRNFAYYAYKNYQLNFDIIGAIELTKFWISNDFIGDQHWHDWIQNPILKLKENIPMGRFQEMIDFSAADFYYLGLGERRLVWDEINNQVFIYEEGYVYDKEYFEKIYNYSLIHLTTLLKMSKKYFHEVLLEFSQGVMGFSELDELAQEKLLNFKNSLEFAEL